ncbi:MAG: hypothetical protein QXE99_02000 [Acidilobaceae archaeon]
MSRVNIVHAVVGLIIFISIYIVPYTLLSDHRGWLIYCFWTIAALIMIIITWRETSRWLRD